MSTEYYCVPFSSSVMQFRLLYANLDTANTRKFEQKAGKMPVRGSGGSGGQNTV
jgi:hypothetical protein